MRGIRANPFALPVLRASSTLSLGLGARKPETGHVLPEWLRMATYGYAKM